MCVCISSVFLERATRICSLMVTFDLGSLEDIVWGSGLVFRALGVHRKSMGSRYIRGPLSPFSGLIYRREVFFFFFALRTVRISARTTVCAAGFCPDHRHFFF